MDFASLSWAFLAGNLATVNPCGFALLPAFLTFYVGADERSLPSTSSRVAQGLIVGLMVTAAFLAVFTLVGIAVAYVADSLASAIPWVTMLVGGALIAMGVTQLLGRHLSFALPANLVVGRERRLSTFFLFGVAYAISSLGCTLLVFISVIAISLTSRGPLAGLAVFAAYAMGMGILIVALSISAAMLRTGLAKGLRRLMPRLTRITGGFLVVVGLYLIAYWGSTIWVVGGPASSPVLEIGGRLSSVAQILLESDLGRWLTLGAGAVVCVAFLAVALRSIRNPNRDVEFDDSQFEAAIEGNRPPRPPGQPGSAAARSTARHGSRKLWRLPRWLILYYAALVAAAVLLAGALLAVAHWTPTEQGNLLILFSAAQPDKATIASVSIHGRDGWQRLGGSLSLAVPVAPDTAIVVQAELPTGRYDAVRIGERILPVNIVIEIDRLEPVLVEIRAGVPRNEGVFVGSEEVSLGLNELAGHVKRIPEFHLVDQFGRSFDSQTITGHVVVLAAFHTNCTVS